MSSLIQRNAPFTIASASILRILQTPPRAAHLRPTLPARLLIFPDLIGDRRRPREVRAAAAVSGTSLRIYSVAAKPSANLRGLNHSAALTSRCRFRFLSKKRLPV